MEVVKELLGHKNIKETEIYAKVMDSTKDEAIDWCLVSLFDMD